ncbi:hypothetical protein AAZX31_16G034500 [Glycine max]
MASLRNQNFSILLLVSPLIISLVSSVIGTSQFSLVSFSQYLNQCGSDLNLTSQSPKLC